MNEKYKKPYDPHATETSIYEAWEQSGYFNPDVCIKEGVAAPDADTFSIVLPPPNETGILHIGHASMVAIQDIMVRFARMRGLRTLWIPGTDHAAIATNSKVEKLLAKKKIRRHDIGREAFLEEVAKFTAESRGTILEQTKRLGASLDWSRLAYTLDPERTVAVNTAFKRLYDMGLIYRGSRIVNWDVKGQTVISDDEIVRKEETTEFYYFKYGPFVIGTARPETKFGDKYVVVHPDDARYAEYAHGQKIDLEWINGPITATVIKDEAADPEMGSGAMTITPWHSQVDFEIAERHDLDREQIIDQYGKLLPVASEFEGMKITEAREKIVEKLAAKGLVEKIDENYTHQLATAERTGGIIEPQIMRQWFIDVNKKFKVASEKLQGIEKGEEKSLKEIMLQVVRGGQIQILPERFEKIYFHWIENLRDWNISRQIWFGHRVPVWYDKEQNLHLHEEQEIIFVRHGQSEGNEQKVYGGHSPHPLTKKGQEQATQTGEQLKKRTIAHIISSDLIRAKETASRIAQAVGIAEDTIEYWPELREVDPGNSIVETSAVSGISILEQAIQNKNEGETAEEISERAETVLAKLRELKKDGPIVVVGHNSFNSAIFSKVKKQEPSELITHRRSWGVSKNASTRSLFFLHEPTEKDLTQEEDTLDTWFSSGLWTFSTLGWPNEAADLKAYHPTSVLETGYDIIFFWVARMILMTTALMGEIPFETVYLHGLVRDGQGRKISKSLGNNIDPADMSDKYGTDALRMSLIVGVGPGADNALSEDKIRAYKKFANKLWNISRFVFENTDDFEKTDTPLLPTDQKHVDALSEMIPDITKDLTNYKFYLAGEKLYHYIWHELADNILEESKEALNGEDATARASKQAMLLEILSTCLRLMHPFMPFITEEIWKDIPASHKTHPHLLIEPWPHAE